MAVGGLASPVAALERTVFVDCSEQESADHVLSGFPANDTFSWFLYYDFDPAYPGGTGFSDNLTVRTDSSGSARIDLPFFGDIYHSMAFYQDTNGNERWDPDIDDTLFRGDVTLLRERGGLFCGSKFVTPK